MGLSSFPTPADGGVIPLLVMNTVISVALLKSMVRSVLQVLGITRALPPLDGDGDEAEEEDCSDEHGRLRMRGTARKRRELSSTQFKFLFGSMVEECSVCLRRFEGKKEEEEEEEVISELPCEHFFHKVCLEKWFHNGHTTCPLCRRSVLWFSVLDWGLYMLF